ncbi:MAG: ATP-binding cassette domain-containing protein [Acidobacteriaceae bacterium]|nr:ATP-binding cassette domain-containing protein [Acidobacteriaceae bacterium]
MLEADFRKQRREFLVDVQLRLPDHGCMALFGASGSGKSTILSCIAGLEQPDSGRIVFEDVQFFPAPLPLHLRPLGYLTQEPNLFPHLTVEQNVLFGIDDRPSEAQRSWLDHLRSSLGIGPIWHASASRISGGQARRVGLARMLARRPPLVLLDEPFTGLDRQLVRELVDALLAWRSEIRFSMIVVDHEAEILERLCSCVAVIADGRIVQQGTWAQVRASPIDEKLKALLAPL